MVLRNIGKHPNISYFVDRFPWMDGGGYAPRLNAKLHRSCNNSCNDLDRKGQYNSSKIICQHTWHQNIGRGGIYRGIYRRHTQGANNGQVPSCSYSYFSIVRRRGWDIQNLLPEFEIGGKLHSLWHSNITVSLGVCEHQISRTLGEKDTLNLRRSRG